jgi:hypothetical protein
MRRYTFRPNGSFIHFEDGLTPTPADRCRLCGEELTNEMCPVDKDNVHLWALFEMGATTNKHTQRA